MFCVSGLECIEGGGGGDCGGSRCEGCWYM